MTINVSDTVVICWNGNTQKALVISVYQQALLSMLDKLGLKNLPYRDYATVWTNSVPGNYQISYTTNQVFVSTGHTQTDVSYKIPQEPKPPKKFGSPDKDQRRQWRTTSTKHSRNTGRQIGRR